MASSINTNLGAIVAANALSKNERDMNGAMERLSTGKRINSAQDDAAGLAIASRMTSQINSLDQAVRNAGNAISLVQSADGAMIEVTNMVQRMRELAIQAISDSNTSSDRQALNLEFQALSAEISRIGGNTQWNGSNILDGLSGVNGMSTFHIGANANQTITTTMPTIGSTEGDFTVDSTARTNRAAGATVAGTAGVFTIPFADADASGAAAGNALTITSGGNTATVSLFDGGAALYDNAANSDLLTAINAQLDASAIALTATYIAPAAEVTAVPAVFTVPPVVGVAETLTISDGTTTITTTSATSANAGAMATLIQGHSDYGNLNFTVAASGSDLVFTQKTAAPVASGGAITFAQSVSSNPAVAATTAGVAAVAAISGNVFAFTQDASDLGSTAPTVTSTLDGANLAVTVATAPVAATGPQISTLELSSIFGTLREGDTVAYTVDGRAASATISSTQNPDKSWTMTAITENSQATGKTAGKVELKFIDSQTLILTGTNPNEPFVVNNVQVTRGIGADVAGTDIATFGTATAALSVLDTAVASVNMKRAELGATANRLEYASDNMAQVSMNARAARSRIEDADYAAETTELARTQIIQQAGTAMLAQANQSTQSVLKLLQ